MPERSIGSSCSSAATLRSTDSTSRAWARVVGMTESKSASTLKTFEKSES